MRYDIAWGDESDSFEADNAADAWSLFCSKHPNAQKHPNKFDRTVTVHVPAVVTETPVEETAVLTTDEG